MVSASCIGFCRSRDNKRLFELIDSCVCKSDKIDEHTLKQECKAMKQENWKIQQKMGIDNIASNDFTMFDRMLDTTCLVGNIPRKYYWEGGRVPLEIYFSMAFGKQKDKFDVKPFAMSNWLGGNYLYYVPEFSDSVEFTYSDNKPIVEALEAKSLGITPRTVLLAPMSYLLLGEQNANMSSWCSLGLIDELTQVYKDVFDNLKRIGINSVQLDDPMIFLSINEKVRERYEFCYDRLREYAGDMEINLVTYFSDLSNNIHFINSLPIDSLHVDIASQHNLDELLPKISTSLRISVGVVNGNDVWKNNLDESLSIVSRFCKRFKTENVSVANSCPMFCIPSSINMEQHLPEELKAKMSFGEEKLHEISLIKRAINNGSDAITEELEANRKLFLGRSAKKIVDFHSEEKEDNKEDGSFFDSSTLKERVGNLQKYDISTLSIEAPAVGDDKFSIQNSSGLSVCSYSVMKNSFDISNFATNVKNTFLLDSLVPRSGFEYYHPNIIVGVADLYNKDIVIENIKDAKKKFSKPFKLSLCSPNHYLNFSFIDPCLDTETVRRSVFECFVNYVDNVKQVVDLIQINDFTLTNGSLTRDYNRKAIASDVAFMKKISFFKARVFATSYTPSADIRSLCDNIDADLLILQSSFFHKELMESFVLYKPIIPICFGVFTPKSKRVPSKNEIQSYIKKIKITLGDGVFFAVCIDDDFQDWWQGADIKETLHILQSSVKAVLKGGNALEKGRAKKTKTSK